MIASKSPLEWIHFGILKWEQSFNQPENIQDNINVAELFKLYEIDIDFSHSSPSEGVVNVLLQLNINSTENPITGYTFKIEAIGVFDSTGAGELPENQKIGLELSATTNLMISRIRGTIGLLSSQGPFGQYELPLLNLDELMNKKAELTSGEN